jgi:hypothetical protein
MIKDDKGISQQKYGIGDVEDSFGRFRQSLKKAHHIIPQITDGTATQSRQTRKIGRREAA